MTSMARRAFLRFAAAAPVALPVAAKEAAAGMGLQGALGGAMLGKMPVPDGMPCSPAPGDVYDHATWLRQQIAELLSDEGLKSARINAREEARRLDPDLAALRSVSPAFAYQAQVDRSAARHIERQRDWMTRDLAKHLKGKIGL
mgnify:CR=1 FL=1